MVSQFLEKITFQLYRLTDFPRCHSITSYDTRASLFVMPTFHASPSATLEVAIAPSSVYGDRESASSKSLQGNAGLQSGYVPQNASDLISRGTSDGWSISDLQSTEGSVIWEACRYYEVGDIQEGVQQIISNAFLGEGAGLIKEHIEKKLYIAFTQREGPESRMTQAHVETDENTSIASITPAAQSTSLCCRSCSLKTLLPPASGRFDRLGNILAPLLRTKRFPRG